MSILMQVNSHFGQTLLFTPNTALVQGVQINNMDQKDNHSSRIGYWGRYPDGRTNSWTFFKITPPYCTQKQGCNEDYRIRYKLNNSSIVICTHYKIRELTVTMSYFLNMVVTVHCNYGGTSWKWGMHLYSWIKQSGILHRLNFQVWIWKFIRKIAFFHF